MFEQLTPDPGEQGLTKAARIFYIVAVFNLLGAVLGVFAYGEQPLLFRFVSGGLSVVVAVLAVVTARGIENRRKWAKWLGISLACLSLLNVPVGTIIGVAILVYINRASKAGLLSA